MPNKKIKVSIIEDSEIHREWLQMEISEDQELEVISSDRFGKKGLESVKVHRPAIAIVDFQLEDITGLEVARKIKLYDSAIKIFALTAHTEISIIERMMGDKNIDAIAIKGSVYFEENLLLAIRQVISGGTYLDPSLLKKFRELKNPNGLNKLTKREFEIFIQANSGKSDEKIASDLCVELSHVRNIKSRLTKKIKKKNMNGLLLKLIENAHII